MKWKKIEGSVYEYLEEIKERGFIEKYEELSKKINQLHSKLKDKFSSMALHEINWRVGFPLFSYLLIHFY